MGKDVTVKLTGQPMRAETGVLSWTKTREYWEKAPAAPHGGNHSHNRIALPWSVSGGGLVLWSAS